MKHTKKQIRERRMLRLAQLIHDHWEEGAGMDTRLFEVPLLHDTLVLKGRSRAGGTYREHVVPRVLLRDECLKLLNAGATVEDVKECLLRYLWIVHITPEEAKRLNLSHKVTMPAGWIFGEGDAFARLAEVGIELEPNQVLEPTG